MVSILEGSNIEQVLVSSVANHCMKKSIGKKRDKGGGAPNDQLMDLIQIVQST